MYGLYVAGTGAEIQDRQLRIISNNLANVDTPGFKARDFDFSAVLKNELPAMRMASTRSGHIQPDNGLVTSGQTQYRVPMQPSLDGNTVDAQMEYGNFASNALEYQTSLRFLNGKIKGLMLAIKGQ